MQRANIIESKSFKLYLNSFNQQRFECVETVQKCLTQDLSVCADGQVTVTIHPLAQADLHTENLHDAICIDALDIEVDCYTLRLTFSKTVRRGQWLKKRSVAIC